MSDLLSIGASGVRAYQTALTTVSENIANTGVSGYSRRTVALREVSAGIGMTADNFSGGNGVLATGIRRAEDTYAAASLRSAGADLSRTQTTTTWLDRIGSALTGNALSTRMSTFFNAAQGLAAEPTSSSLRATMIGAATSAGDSFAATGQALDQVDADIDSAGRLAAQGLTSLGASLAAVNDGLGRTTPGTAAAAQLLDQRDSLLDQISGIADVQSSTDALGRVNVRFGSGTGIPFVQADQSGSVAYRRDPTTGDVSFVTSTANGWTALSPNGGQTAGLIEAADRVRDVRANLNNVATQFTSAANTMQASGQDANGVAGQPFFTIGARPTDITVALADGSKIAAAKPNGGTRDGSNLATLQSLRASTGVEAQTTAIITDNAALLKQRTTIADAQTSIRAGAETALAASTGVNLDSEAIDLMRFQQAYQASSRIIQVARETFQSILDIR